MYQMANLLIKKSDLLRTLIRKAHVFIDVKSRITSNEVYTFAWKHWITQSNLTPTYMYI